MKIKTSEAKFIEIKSDLKNFILPGTRLYVSLVSVSKSGLSRTLKVYVVESGMIQNITRDVAQLLDLDWDAKKEAVKVGGGGFNVAEWLVAKFSETLLNDRTALRSSIL